MNTEWPPASGFRCSCLRAAGHQRFSEAEPERGTLLWQNRFADGAVVRNPGAADARKAAGRNHSGHFCGYDGGLFFSSGPVTGLKTAGCFF